MGERKDLFVEENVTEHDDTLGRVVEATVALVIGGVAEEGADRGAWGELVCRGAKGVGIA